MPKRLPVNAAIDTSEPPIPDAATSRPSVALRMESQNVECVFISRLNRKLMRSAHMKRAQEKTPAHHCRGFSQICRINTQR